MTGNKGCVQLCCGWRRPCCGTPTRGSAQHVHTYVVFTLARLTNDASVHGAVGLVLNLSCRFSFCDVIPRCGLPVPHVPCGGVWTLPGWFPRGLWRSSSQSLRTLGATRQVRQVAFSVSLTLLRSSRGGGCRLGLSKRTAERFMYVCVCACVRVIYSLLRLRVLSVSRVLSTCGLFICVAAR